MNKTVIKILAGIFIGFLILGTVIFGVIYFALSTTFKNSEPYQKSIEMIKTNPEIVEYLGDNIERYGMFSGGIQSDLLGSRASIHYKVEGSKAKAYVYVNAVKENGDQWTYNQILVFKDGDENQVVDLTPTEQQQ